MKRKVENRILNDLNNSQVNWMGYLIILQEWKINKIADDIRDKIVLDLKTSEEFKNVEIDSNNLESIIGDFSVFPMANRLKIIKFWQSINKFRSIYKLESSLKHNVLERSNKYNKVSKKNSVSGGHKGNFQENKIRKTWNYRKSKKQRFEKEFNNNNDINNNSIKINEFNNSSSNNYEDANFSDDFINSDLEDSDDDAIDENEFQKFSENFKGLRSRTSSEPYTSSQYIIPPTPIDSLVLYNSNNSTPTNQSPTFNNNINNANQNNNNSVDRPINNINNNSINTNIINNNCDINNKNNNNNNQMLMYMSSNSQTLNGLNYYNLNNNNYNYNMSCYNNTQN